MKSRSAEMAAEQDYFDAAAAHLARSLKALGNAQSAAAHPGVAAHLKRHAEAAADAINRADHGVAFGRIDRATTSATFREILDAMWLFNQKFERALFEFNQIRAQQ